MTKMATKERTLVIKDWEEAGKKGRKTSKLGSPLSRGSQRHPPQPFFGSTE
jgi:hypothetical protein